MATTANVICQQAIGLASIQADEVCSRHIPFLDHLKNTKSLAEIIYENNFFDQAHFIKDFKQFTGDTPEHFKRFL